MAITCLSRLAPLTAHAHPYLPLISSLLAVIRCKNIEPAVSHISHFEMSSVSGGVHACNICSSSCWYIYLFLLLLPSFLLSSSLLLLPQIFLPPPNDKLGSVTFSPYRISFSFIRLFMANFMRLSVAQTTQCRMIRWLVKINWRDTKGSGRGIISTLSMHYSAGTVECTAVLS